MTIDLTNPDNTPFGQLPRATQEAMVAAHLLDSRRIDCLGPSGFYECNPYWYFDTVYRVVPS